jgi:hypothetical protein
MDEDGSDGSTAGARSRVAGASTTDPPSHLAGACTSTSPLARIAGRVLREASSKDSPA